MKALPRLCAHISEAVSVTQIADTRCPNRVLSKRELSEDSQDDAE